MSEIVKIDNEVEPELVNGEVGLMELTEELLLDARTSIDRQNVLRVPVAELATLGAGVSSLIPTIEAVTKTTELASEGLYRVANAAKGDVLKIAKNGNAWGAMKTAEGKSKMVQLASVDPLSAGVKTAAACNPAIMMVAVALYSIEKELSEIAETQKEILSFLEIENESQIEADVETLMSIVSNYKYNWDNELSVSSSHKLVLDIQNRARKNMIAYQKKVNETVSSKKFVLAQNKVNTTLSDLEKKFKYYRLSLYTYSLASLMEIMLSGNYKEEYIIGVKEEIKTLSMTYREQFEKGSLYLEKIGRSGVETNVVKGIGSASKAVGKLIGNIPIAKEKHADDFLQDKGDFLRSSAVGMEKEVVKEFATLGNPGTSVFVNKMEDMVQIYNHTSQICFDDQQIYLIAN